MRFFLLDSGIKKRLFEKISDFHQRVPIALVHIVQD